jgi:hypothetical protein
LAEAGQQSPIVVVIGGSTYVVVDGHKPPAAAALYPGGVRAPHAASLTSRATSMSMAVGNRCPTS